MNCNVYSHTNVSVHNGANKNTSCVESDDNYKNDSMWLNIYGFLCVCLEVKESVREGKKIETAWDFSSLSC